MSVSNATVMELKGLCYHSWPRETFEQQKRKKTTKDNNHNSTSVVLLVCVFFRLVTQGFYFTDRSTGWQVTPTGPPQSPRLYLPSHGLPCLHLFPLLPPLEQSALLFKRLRVLQIARSLCSGKPQSVENWASAGARLHWGLSHNTKSGVPPIAIPLLLCFNVINFL